MPDQFLYGSTPSTIINADYNSPPIADFSFQEIGGKIRYSSPSDYSGFPVTFGPFYELGKLYGFELTISIPTIRSRSQFE